MKDTKGATERKQQVNYKQQQKILQVVTDRCSFFYPPQRYQRYFSLRSSVPDWQAGHAV